MAEFSLAAIEAQRGATVERLEFRVATKPVPQPVVEAAGLGTILTGRAYGLGEAPKPGDTLLHARVTRTPEVHNWVCVFERIPDGEIPEDVVQRSESVGGMEGFIERLDPLLVTHFESPSVILVEYRYPEMKTKLLRTKGFSAGKITVNPVGAYWDVDDAPILVAVSLMRPPSSDEDSDYVSLTAVGQHGAPGWPELQALEAQIWHDVQQVVAGSK